MSTAILRSLRDISTALERADVPPLSPWWGGQCDRFYSHPSATTFVGMVGRGGDKSRTSVVMALAEVLAGEFVIPRGERHFFTHVSENRDEASKTLGILESYLRILHVPFARAGDTIELKQLPRGFKVLACRVGAVSGWRCLGWTADECAKWSSEGSDPSAEVIASIRAMTVTHPSARGRMISSPLGNLGHFYEAYAAGDTPEQVTAHAPSWVANPTITEARTHQLARDTRVWSREYAAVAQAGASAAFDVALVDRARGVRVPSDWTTCETVAIIDPSAGASDAFAWGFARWRKRPGGDQSVLEILDIDGLSQGAAKGVTSDDVVKKIAASAGRHGVRTVHSDQFEKWALASAFTRRGFAYVAHTWTAPQKERCVEHVRGWLRDGLLALPQHERLRTELLNFEERISASGALTFRSRGGESNQGCRRRDV